jgi:hypothetical protein
MFWHAPACHRPFQASERLDSPFSPCGRRGLLTGGDVLARPCVPSPVSGIRTPRLPLLPLWEKGVGGMRGNGARECRTSLISPKHPTLESAPPGCAGVPPARSATKVRTAWVRGRPARTQQHKGTHRLGARASRPHAAPQRYAPPGCAGVPPACSAVTYSRFGHQNTQTPPSPLVGEGGWGDEGQRRILRAYGITTSTYCGNSFTARGMKPSRLSSEQ